MDAAWTRNPGRGDGLRAAWLPALGTGKKVVCSLQQPASSGVPASSQ